ncbi:MAG: hypothetical protein NT157_02585 [Candidatus Micrarchaeota archaeon]|nr:hypothetical protein [Candidatus Micrarchaeota archaeon]
MKVTTTAGAGAWVDVEWNGPAGWGPIYSHEAVLTNGERIFSTMYNGTHRAKFYLTGYVTAYSIPIEITTCVPPKTCTDKEDCSSDEVCIGGTCVKGDCVANSDCPASKNCTSEHKCETVACACGQITNHACVSYQCCKDADCGAEEVCTSHTCRSESLPPDPAAEEATAAISEAQTAITAASAAGKDVSGAEILLATANEKYAAKDYASAKTLANSAKSVVLALTGGNGSGNNGSGNQTSIPEETGPFSIGSPMCILGIFIALAFILAAVFALIIGVVIYREKRKRR